jgi:hypothetical protein
MLAERSRIYAEHCRNSRIRPNFYGNDYTVKNKFNHINNLTITYQQ